MAHATQLNATEQDTLVKQIGLALLRTAPRDWQRITAHYRTVGRYHELEGEVTLADGSQQEWAATQDIASLFNRLRAGMYREERGTWFNAHYTLEAPASYNLEYDREEPRWQHLPPQQAYTDELRMFPRTEENIPDWLMERVAGVGPEPMGPHFRFARIFDGTNQAGRPVIERQELSIAEQDHVLSYLGAAPVVLPGRGYDIDRLAPAPEARVPVAFHSDGTWIWPAAVNYYLQEYGIAPEAELVEHIRKNRFQVPRVTDEQRAAAHDYLTKGDGGAQQPDPRGAAGPAAGAPPGATTTPSTPAPTSAATTMVDPPWRRTPENGAGPPPDATEATQVWHPPAGLGAPPPDATEQTEVWHPPADLTGKPAAPNGDLDEGSAEQGDHEPVSDHSRFDEPPFDDAHYEDAQPAEPAHEQPRPDRAAQASISTQYFDPRDAADDGFEDFDVEDDVEDHAYPDEPAITRLRTMLHDLDVPTSAYRIGEPAAHGWSIERVEHGWRVGWYDDTLTNPSMFGDASDAAAFMLGKLLLEPGEASEDVDVRGAGDPALDETDTHHEVNGTHRDVADALSAPPSGMARPPQPQPTTVTPPVGAAPGAPQPTTGTPPATSGAGAEAAPTTFQPPASRPATPPQGTPAAAGAPSPATPSSATPASGGAPSQPGNWPIQPLPGEPPLTLFRGKQMEDLPIGSEIDRFGNPDGNLTYVAGTPFEERSLVPEWVNRPYHVYRVQRPIEALSGVAIPWFSQPGGGTAYVLPAAIEDLVADGVLIELDPGEPPVD
ncbi:TNT domain-containing protein [Haloechinothrix salitolerans]|uniref:Glycohydrolase toxin TNT-related protein n=1 Tax=Haloechinothrix salitolerans TaxID=926830 RepID=A0ABW2C7Z2_9PSEU